MPILSPSPDYFLASLESLESQRFKDFELIIVSDGHNEDIQRLIERTWSFPIRLIRNSIRAGFRRSLNIGLESSDSDLIARLDSDDISKPDRFMRQVKEFDANEKLSLIGTNTDIISDNGELIGRRSYPSSHKEIMRCMPRFCPFAHSSIMMKRLDVMDLGGYDVKERAEDYDLWSRIAKNHECMNVQDCLTTIRNRDDSLRGSQMRMNQLSVLSIKKNIYRSPEYNSDIWSYISFLGTMAVFIMPPSLTRRLLDLTIRQGYFSNQRGGRIV
jgi:glycosyltransferase involved in cell wall biosynthesis